MIESAKSNKGIFLKVNKLPFVLFLKIILQECKKDSATRFEDLRDCIKFNDI